MQGRDDGLPNVADTTVERRRLLTQLDEISTRTVTVVSAPAGTGKTTLLVHWCQRSSRRVRWLNATEPARVVDDVVELLASARGARPTARGGADHDRLQALAGEQPDLVVVVDRLDSVALADAGLALAHRFVAAGGAHLVLSGRCAAAPGLVPMVLGGDAWRLEPSELYLTVDDVEPVMQAHVRRPIVVSDADAATARLDGWMAAAALAAIGHPGGDVPADDLLDLAQESIEAYVASEVLRGIDADLRHFAADTACVEELDPRLCDAITGHHDSELKLARLRSAGFPLVRSVDGGSRLLRPVREVLTATARRTDPERHTQGLRAAATWYSEQDLPFEAAECLARVGAWEEIIPIVLRHMPQILERDEIARLAELIASAPEHVLRQHASLALGIGWVLRMDGRVSAAVQLLNVYEPYLDDRAVMIADIGRASVASWSDDMAAADAFADKAVAACDELGDDAFDDVASRRLLPQSFGKDTTDMYRTFAHGAGLLACAYGGMWDHAALHTIEVAPDTFVRMPQIRVVEQRGIRATFAALSGEAVNAALEADAGLAGAGQSQLQDNRASADALFALGEAHRLQLRYGDARPLLEQARQLAELNDRRNLIGTTVAAEAHLAIDTRQVEHAARLLDEFRTRSPQRLPLTVAGLVAAAEARVLIAGGRYHAAVRTLETVPLTPATASARVAALIGAGDIADAQHTVRDWPAVPTVDSTVRRAIAAAAICDHTGDRRRASLLRTAFDAARPHLLLQPFIEFGPEHARLLRDTLKPDNPFNEQLLGWLATDANVLDAPRLTARETTIMSHLADGRKVREVAGDLHLSLNTVRTHARTAYRKLGVNNRADAVRAWRRRATAEDRPRQ